MRVIFYPESAAEQAADQELPGAGWFPDPHTPGLDRYWDGSRWTDHVRQGVVQGDSGSVPAASPAQPVPVAHHAASQQFGAQHEYEQAQRQHAAQQRYASQQHDFASQQYGAGQQYGAHQPSESYPHTPSSALPAAPQTAAYAPAAPPPATYQPQTRPRRSPARVTALFAIIIVGLAAAFQYGPVGDYLPDLGPAERSASSLGRQPVLSEEYPVFGSTELVNHLERGMLAQEDHIDVSQWAQGEELETMLKAAQEAGTQNPYIFTRAWQVQQFGSRTTIMPTYIYSAEDADQRRADTRKAVAEGIASADVLRASSDTEKAARIHDFIVTTAEYDEAALNAIDRDLDYSLLAQSQEAYGILVAGTAVCNGYAQAFAAMAEEAGLDAVIITGTDSLGLTGELHAWNKVLIDGRWLVVDTTWDDPIGGPAEPVRDYFLLDDNDPLLASRKPDAEWAVAESLALFD